MAIEHSLDRLRGVGARSGRVDGASVRGGERGAQVLGGGEEALHLGEQGLDLDVPDERQVRAGGEPRRMDS